MFRDAENPLQFGLIWRHLEGDEACGRPRPITTNCPWSPGQTQNAFVLKIQDILERCQCFCGY